MKIYINEQEIDYSLDNENMLGDLLPSLEQEIKKSGGTVLSVLLNGKSISFSSEEWKNIPIEKIDTLHLEADDIILTEITQLKLIVDYLDILEQVISNHQEVPQALEPQDLQHILDNIDRLCMGTTHTTLKSLLTYICASIGLFNADTTQSISSDMNSILTQVRVIISYRIQSLMTPTKQWIYINSLIKNNLDIFHKIIEYLNSSTNFLGIQLLILYIDLLDLWINALSMVPSHITNTTDTESWLCKHKTYTQNLQKYLEELSNAIEVKDWITVSDLLEYEITPLLREYLTCVETYYPEK